MKIKYDVNNSEECVSLEVAVDALMHDFIFEVSPGTKLKAQYINEEILIHPEKGAIRGVTAKINGKYGEVTSSDAISGRYDIALDNQKYQIFKN